MDRFGLTVSKIGVTDFPELQSFCEKAARAGYVNNATFKTMKVHLIGDGSLSYWCIRRNTEIVGVSGCQALPQLGDGCFRILFRSCVLPDTVFVRGLASSVIATSPLWRLILPEQIEWARKFGASRLVVTVNSSEPSKPLPRSMIKVGRALERLNETGLLSLWLDQVNLYETLQKVYVLNESHYFRVLHEVDRQEV